MNSNFKALVVDQSSKGKYKRSVNIRNLEDLPKGDLLIKVHYSSLNYKDALSATGNKGVTKKYPHTPGIDAAGIVSESGNPRFKPGDKVIVTSYDLGQNTDGGFGQYIRIPAEWAVALPVGITLRESMILGTAGLTAAIGIHHLQSNNTTPEKGPVLVTGATGGVGTLAVSVLSKIGYEVVAATGKTDQYTFLKKLGSSEVIHRNEILDKSRKLLLSARWSGVIETVGSTMLDTAIRQCRQNGTVTCCGNVLGPVLNTNVYPFILRGVSLMGIDSGNCKMNLRKKLWHLLAGEWKPHNLNSLHRECRLEDLEFEIDRMLDGNNVGRVLVNLKK